MGASSSRNRPAQHQTQEVHSNSASPGGAAGPTGGPYSGYAVVQRQYPAQQFYPRGPQQPPPGSLPHVPNAGRAPNYPHQASNGGSAPQPQSYGGASSPGPAPERRKTKTVRNDVNLKKHTLKMVALEGEPATFFPSFRFDCGAPCTVSIFYLATENTGNKLSLNHGLGTEVGPRVHYDKRLGCEFPPSDMDPAELRQYCVDAAGPECSDGQLSKVGIQDAHGREIWPLCVRLECIVADEAEGSEHSIDSVPVGGAMPGWIQSQTTYACLPKREMGFDAKVLKQKIWVRETAYELQEIYGLENANKSNAVGGGNPSDDIGRECVICMSEPRDTTLLPCRHMCLCHECAKMLRTQTNKCPICRTPVQSLLEITVKT